MPLAPEASGGRIVAPRSDLPAMLHRISDDDRRFRETVEACHLNASEFTHRAHIRLAYVMLAEQDDEAALVSMRSSLQALLRHYGLGRSNYHETMTRAWLLEVRQAMETSPPCSSAAEFIDANPMLLDKTIMQTHYSPEVLRSREARTSFVQPDLAEIPRYDLPLA